MSPAERGRKRVGKQTDDRRTVQTEERERWTSCSIHLAMEIRSGEANFALDRGGEQVSKVSFPDLQGEQTASWPNKSIELLGTENAPVHLEQLSPEQPTG